MLSVVVLLYLAYPTLVKQSMAAFQCERVGDALWLAADLQEPCFVGAHLTMVLLVSLPQILLYTVGLPLAATILLYRRRERLGRQAGAVSLGSALRGVQTQGLVVGTLGGRSQGLHDPRRRPFGFHLKPDMQVHLALFLIALMIVAHLIAMPFDELTKDHRVLHWLEMGSLSMLVDSACRNCIFYR